MNEPLTEDELRLRESIIRQNQGMQNIAPGSPLYDRIMGAAISSNQVREANQQLNKNLHDSLDKIAANNPGRKQMNISTQVKIAFCMLGFSIGVFCVLITMAVMG